jgi:hypothetical protein
MEAKTLDLTPKNSSYQKAFFAFSHRVLLKTKSLNVKDRDSFLLNEKEHLKRSYL